MLTWKATKMELPRTTMLTHAAGLGENPATRARQGRLPPSESCVFGRRWPVGC